MAELPDINKLDKPPLTIKFGDIEIKMTYGLELDLLRLLPDPSSALQLMMRDPFTQDYIVRRALTNKELMVIDEKELSETMPLTSEQVQDLLMWVADHALYSFTKRAIALGTLGARYETALQLPSLSGSTDSPSTKPSAGPSELTKETSTDSTGPSPEENSNSAST